MRVLIVDDHQLFIDGIRHIIDALDRDVEIMEATTADLAWQQLDAAADIDLVLLDLHMPGVEGGSIMQHERIRKSCLPIVIISGEENPRTIKAILDAGAMGFIPKSYSGKSLLNALRTVLNGEIHIPESIHGQLQRFATSRAGQRDHAVGSTGITRRQYEVLQLIASGDSNKQISSKLFLTENTVKAHVSALLRSLGASNRTECVSIARHKGLIG